MRLRPPGVVLSMWAEEKIRSEYSSRALLAAYADHALQSQSNHSETPRKLHIHQKNNYQRRKDIAIL